MFFDKQIFCYQVSIPQPNHFFQTTTDSIGTTNYGYNDLYQVTSVNDALSFDIGYDYDEAGNVIKITYPGNKDVIYGYDELNRLETVTNWLSQVTTYHYDDAGRLDWLRRQKISRAGNAEKNSACENLWFDLF